MTVGDVRLQVDGGDALLLRAGRIAARGDDALDAGGVRSVELPAGTILAPGFVELQVNGAAGEDFTTDPDAMWRAGPTLARHGVTAFLPTIVSAPPGCVEAALEALRHPPPALPPGAVPLGLHVEGPFLAAARRGAHPLEHLRPPSIDAVRSWDPPAVRVVTMAPELPGAIEVAGALHARGVVVAAGHTDADAATTTRAVDAGVRAATHLFNAMSPLGHRRPGAAGALLLDRRVTVTLIADGLHVDPRVVDLAWRVAGPDRMALVSDAMAALGVGDGDFPLGTERVEVRGGTARLADGTVAGAVAGLDAGLRNLVAATGCSSAHALAAVTRTPARLLGLDDGRGELRIGGRADIVVLSADLAVEATLVGGEVAYAREPGRWD